MTIAEFNKHNENHDMPYDWIGQGMGYKSEWNPDRPDDIIYIPESAYDDYYDEDGDEDDKVIDRKEAFSTQDFIDLCDGDLRKAKELFLVVDWQYPDGEVDELNEWFEEIEEYEKEKKSNE